MNARAWPAVLGAVLVGVTGGARAHGEPAATAPTQAPAPDAVPAPQPEPAPKSTAPEVSALDGAARNYVRAPRGSEVRGAFLWRGTKVGLAWVLRVVLSPFRGALYVESRWHATHRGRLLFENEPGTLGVVPTVSFLSNFGLELGAKAFVDHYVDDEEVSLAASTGGPVRLAVQLKGSQPHIGRAPVYLRTRLRYEDSSNLLFAGIGNPTGAAAPTTPVPATAAAIETRFSQKRVLAVVGTGVQLSRALRIGTSAIYNDRKFGPADEDDVDPSIEQVYDTSTLRGFEDGVHTLELTGDVELDTRSNRGDPQDGMVLRGFAGAGSVMDDGSYAHYGAEASGYWAPFWHRRVFVGRVAFEGVRDRNHDLPFTELPRLGGAGLLRGYSTDQFRGRLAAIGTLEYHYPIHEYVTGQLFVETGKVAMTYDELGGADTRWRDWHTGAGGGLIVHRHSSVVVRLDVAYGDGVQVYFSTEVLDAFRKREREL